MIDKKLYKFGTAINYYGRFFVLAIILFSCGGKDEIVDKPLYDGPIMSLDSVHTLLSDSAIVLLRKNAGKEEQFENGDTQWPKGLFLEYFDKEGNVTSTFKSDSAYYKKAENIYKGIGDVVVRSIKNGDELNTEELYWDPNKKEFYTDRFVTIRSEDEIHTGEGLTANQDFTSYKILKPAGTFTLEEEAKVPK